MIPYSWIQHQNAAHHRACCSGRWLFDQKRRHIVHCHDSSMLAESQDTHAAESVKYQIGARSVFARIAVLSCTVSPCSTVAFLLTVASSRILKRSCDKSTSDHNVLSKLCQNRAVDLSHIWKQPHSGSPVLCKVLCQLLGILPKIAADAMPLQHPLVQMPTIFGILRSASAGGRSRLT